MGVEEQGVVGPHGDNQQHADQVQDGELLSQQHQACGDCQYRQCKWRYDARGAGGRAQEEGQQNDNAGKARQRQPDDLVQIARIKPVDFTLHVQNHRLHARPESHVSR